MLTLVLKNDTLRNKTYGIPVFKYTVGKCSYLLTLLPVFYLCKF